MTPSVMQGKLRKLGDFLFFKRKMTAVLIKLIKGLKVTKGNSSTAIDFVLGIIFV